MHQGSFMDWNTEERAHGQYSVNSKGGGAGPSGLGKLAPSCCRYGMNITATAELRVWLEVPDTAWWLQLEIPDKHSTGT